MVTTLRFDDGETRSLTDGFFSRPGLRDLALDRPVAPELAGIERALAEAGIERVAAPIPVHSHYDHAMDAGEVAKRTGALVVGSTSTAQVARGAGLAEESIAVPAEGRAGPRAPDRARSAHGVALALRPGGVRRSGRGRYEIFFVQDMHQPFSSTSPWTKSWHLPRPPAFGV
jgi:L-ascorbate metabolism protein UlaG (beta-lactamase superfamily)